MPPKPAGALDEEVYGSEIARHRIEIEIEGLFDHLSRNQNLAGAIFLSAILAENLQHFALDPVAIDESHARMEKHRRLAAIAQGLPGFDRIVDRIADIGDGLAGFRARDQISENVLVILGEGDLHPLFRAGRTRDRLQFRLR